MAVSRLQNSVFHPYLYAVRQHRQPFHPIRFAQWGWKAAGGTRSVWSVSLLAMDCEEEGKTRSDTLTRKGCATRSLAPEVLRHLVAIVSSSIFDGFDRQQSAINFDSLYTWTSDFMALFG